VDVIMCAMSQKTCQCYLFKRSN